MYGAWTPTAEGWVVIHTPHQFLTRWKLVEDSRHLPVLRALFLEQRSRKHIEERAAPEETQFREAIWCMLYTTNNYWNYPQLLKFLENTRRNNTLEEIDEDSRFHGDTVGTSRGNDFLATIREKQQPRHALQVRPGSP